MARAPNNAVRHKFLLPVSLFDRLQARADADETPLAEIIRRMVDLAVTLKIPPPHLTPLMTQDAVKPFTVIIPQKLLNELSYEAKDRGVLPHELIAQTSLVYLKQREKILAKWYVARA